MKRETRDKLVSGTDQSDLTSGNACWETPPLVFAKLNEDFGPFDIDLTADATRHLCPRWFGPDSPVDQFDALGACWSDFGRRGYSNPPYGPFIQKMLAKAKACARGAIPVSSTLLLPMRVTKAFKAHVLDGASQLLFCDSRLVFFENGAPRLNVRQWEDHGRAVPDPAVFDSIVVRYVPGYFTKPDVGIWKVPKHVTPADIDRAIARMKKAA